jgi:hypothetical protein
MRLTVCINGWWLDHNASNRPNGEVKVKKRNWSRCMSKRLHAVRPFQVFPTKWHHACTDYRKEMEVCACQVEHLCHPSTPKIPSALHFSFSVTCAESLGNLSVRGKCDTLIRTCRNDHVLYRFGQSEFNARKRWSKKDS